MITVNVNRETCEGYANCVRAAPDIFDLDSDDLVVLKQEQPADDQLSKVRRATYDCPTESISFTEGAEAAEGA
jgi:ferredoxin